MSRQINARVTKDAPVDSQSAPENELQELRQHVSQTRENQAQTMPSVQESQSADAPQGLSQAADDNLAMPEVSSSSTQETKLAEERLLSIERQLHKSVPKGVQRNIICPYCGRMNFQRKRTFCCELLRFAVVTVLVADRAMRQAEAAEKAMQN